MKTISYARLQSKYGGEYVAHKNNRVIFHAKTFEQLNKKITQKGVDPTKLTIGFIPRKDLLYIYYASRVSI